MLPERRKAPLLLAWFSRRHSKPSEMNCTRDLRKLPDRRSEHKRPFQQGTWTCDVKNPVKMNKKIDARQMKTGEERTENIGLPLKLLDKHDPWPAYVTYTSPMVRRLIEKSKARELECMQALEKRGGTLRQNKSSSIIHLRRRKSSKTTGNMVFMDTDSETTLSVWDAFSVLDMEHTVIPEPVHFHTDSRECPTANYNKIIFSQKPMMRTLPYSSLLTSKEKHSNV
ncbi:PREDICTED: CMT1A duplicated region transcript 4 protein isoform X1 [Hipposideros armiger]|uniref:CMT1A duplicated region transcript 4 protein isoform X1 n=1 Tax=Hipposideros armiger TaxID=186990 RepID=A0A8B7RBS0_HIPAR|nr:PREDICTED: CMT1A duplicated region transcript 4 protein isoform X1 [Hipposideros armiger]